MIKVLVACANGAGSSLMMKMAVEKAMKQLGIKVSDIHHCALAEGVSSARQYDLVFVAQNFLNMYEDALKQGVKVLGLRNVLSDKEVIQKMDESGYTELFLSKQ